MTTENQRLAILGEALYVFTQRLESIFKEGYNHKTTATAIGLANETLTHLKEGLIHSTMEEIAASTKMRRLIDKYPTLKKEGHGVQLDNMESEVRTLFKLFKVNKSEASEQVLRFQLAAYRYQVISQYDLLPYETLRHWWDELEVDTFGESGSNLPRGASRIEQSALLGDIKFRFLLTIDEMFRPVVNMATFQKAEQLIVQSVVPECKIAAPAFNATCVDQELTTFIYNYWNLSDGPFEQEKQIDEMTQWVLGRVLNYKAHMQAGDDTNALAKRAEIYASAAINERPLLPLKYLQPWRDSVVNEVMSKLHRSKEPSVTTQDEFAAVNKPQPLLGEPEVESIQDLIQVLGTMVISDVAPYNTLFSNQLIRFRLTNGQTALGLLGKGDYFVIHQSNGAWEIIDGVTYDHNDEYNKLPDRVLWILLRYALMGVVPKDLLKDIRKRRQSNNLEDQKMRHKLGQHEGILSILR